MRKIFAAILAVAALLMVAGPASAEGETSGPITIESTNPGAGGFVALTDSKNFALACDFGGSSNARARVDITNIGKSALGNDVDADDIWYRSLKTSTNTAATFTPDRVWLQLHNVVTDTWIGWTARGGNALGDGVTVPTSFHWDPAGKTGTPPAFTFDKVRLVANTLGGLQCISPSRGLAID